MDLHNAFKEFDKNITLNKSKKDAIMNSRNAVRDKIRNYYKNELKENQPKFTSQGSFTINTALNPLEGDEVDIDDGLYLQNIDSENESEWPSPKNTHETILKTLKGYTQSGCEDKTSCVRVIYKNDYHIDIPIYIMKDEHAKLANTKTDKWETSDSKDFSDWYYQHRNNDQTSRIVRYLKAWRDNCKLDFSSIELTILCVTYHSTNDDDSIALKNTVQNIYNNLSLVKSIYKPVEPHENLWESKTDAQKNILIKKLKGLQDDLITSIENKSVNRASIILREQFGDRFPLIEDEEKEETREISWSPKPWKKF